MRAFEYFTATDSKHAVALLAEHAPARVLAGGTDLLADLKASTHELKTVVDISRASDMRKIEVPSAASRSARWSRTLKSWPRK